MGFAKQRFNDCGPINCAFKRERLAVEIVEIILDEHQNDDVRVESKPFNLQQFDFGECAICADAKVEDLGRSIRVKIFELAGNRLGFAQSIALDDRISEKQYPLNAIRFMKCALLVALSIRISSFIGLDEVRIIIGAVSFQFEAQDRIRRTLVDAVVRIKLNRLDSRRQRKDSNNDFSNN